jgi:Tfp pilus assembly pilus retraction ATPase PilT
VSTLPLDRILETCYQLNRNALLIAGQSPYWRLDGGLGEGKSPRLSAEGVAGMIHEIMPASDRIEKVPGCQSFRLRYGTERFRVDALGEPTAYAVILTKLPSDAPVSLREGRNWYQDWSSRCAKMNWNELFDEAERAACDVLVVPGCPPFLWSTWGLHAFDTQILTDDDVCSMVADIMPAPESRLQRQGVCEFCMPARQPSGRAFRAAIFGYPSPTLAALVQIGSKVGAA